LLLVKTLYKERNILTKKGMFFKSFCIILFEISVLIVLLLMVGVIHSMIFVFSAGILMGLSSVSMGFLIKHEKKLLKKNISVGLQLRKPLYSYKTYWGFGGSFIALFLFLAACVLIK
jgi:hypothetical protein